MPRRRRSSRQVPDHKNLIPSLALFVISGIVFIHQCITPLYPTHLKNLLPMFFNPQSMLRNREFRTTQMSISEKLQPVAAQNPKTVPGRQLETQATPGAIPQGLFHAALNQWSSVPLGPYPLPPLSPPKSFIGGSTSPGSSLENRTNIYAGSSWTISLARNVLPSLPLHWFAELTRAATSNTPSFTSHSIFRARRKGDWIGCRRPYLLICMAAYRAIKATNALSVLSMDCELHTEWLPHILMKLADELRPVQLRCAVSTNALFDTIGSINSTYGDIGLIEIIEVDLVTGVIPNDTDMLIAYRVIQRQTLIHAVQMLKGIKKSGAVKHLLVDTYPDVENSGATLASEKMRVNTGTAPFWFPAPIFEYANENENSEEVDVEIVVVRVDQLFEERVTPEMKDLVDPRRRKVEER